MQQLELRLNSDYVELNQLLKLTGVCDSGGAGKALVASGVVAVDGKVELRKTCKIVAGQKVTIGDLLIYVLPRRGANLSQLRFAAALNSCAAKHRRTCRSLPDALSHRSSSHLSGCAMYASAHSPIRIDIN